jgi:hypothetical protein
MVQQDTNMDYLRSLFSKLPYLKNLDMQYDSEIRTCHSDGWVGWCSPKQSARSLESALELSLGRSSLTCETEEIHGARVLATLCTPSSKMQNISLSGLCLTTFLRALDAHLSTNDVFSGTRALSLSFHNAGVDSESFDKLGEFIASAKDLRSLHLSFSHYGRYAWLSPDVNDFFERMFYLPQLGKCSLAGLWISMRTLQKFLLQHSSTLRELSLGNIRFIEEPSDFSLYLFSFLAEQFTLDQVNFTGTFVGNGTIATYEKHEVPVTETTYHNYLQKVDCEPSEPSWKYDCLKYRVERYITGKEHNLLLAPSDPAPHAEDLLNPRNKIVWQETQKTKNDGSWYWVTAPFSAP